MHDPQNQSAGAEEQHRHLFGELYQILGELGASAAVLDQVLAAAQGEPLPYETLLPYTSEPSN